MPKIRALKPEFWTDESVVAVQPLARLLFQGLWNYACDNGHVQDKPRQLKMRILPADSCDVSELLDELAGEDLIVRSDGWVVVRTLGSHQKVDKRFFLCCDFPGCGGSDAAENAHKSAMFGNHRRWHEGRALVDADCEFCPSEPLSDDGEPIGCTSGPHRVPDGDPSGTHRGHIADVDGDGDGDGDKDSSSSEIASDPDDHPRDDVRALCERLAEKVRENGHSAKPGKLWFRACRLLLDRDGRTVKQVQDAIDWATADPFWSTNIRSMQNLRQKYSTLQGQASTRRHSAASSGPVRTYEPAPPPTASELDWDEIGAAS